MKRIISSVLTFCLIVALLPFVAVPAHAASGPEKALQSIYYVDIESQTLLEESTTGVLVRDGETNFVITVFPSRENEEIYTVFLTEKGEADFCFFEKTWNQVFSMYVADDAYGEADGFTKLGTVTEGETIYLVLGWDKDGSKGGYTTTASALEDGLISLKEGPGEWSYPIPVINSKNEVCAVYYDDYCFSLITDEATFYANSKAEETKPSATEPPAAESPTPATEPPATESPTPATEPPATEPPAEQPHTPVSPAGEDLENFGLPTDLPELEDLYAAAVTQKKTNQTGVIVSGVIAVLIVTLSVAVLIIRRRNKLKIHEDLNEAEEGTVLADLPVDTGLRLQFRNGKRIAVKRSFTIGRAPDNDVVIPKTSSAVSGRHCEIVVQNGAAYLRDLGSTNGTFINGKRLVTGQLVQLLPGMMVGLGDPNGAEAFAVVVSQK